ncbi:MAG: YbaB/EbfC family nucleoid-associated protein [Planctomycetia bacterium]|nr:YbaB/EbfC family nucleoid-associated protein [Planctomycetia bacterium]
MFGFGDFGKMMSLAMTLGKTIDASKQELGEKVFSASAGDVQDSSRSGLVEIQMNGLVQTQSVSIAPEILVPERAEELEALVQQVLDNLGEQLKSEYKERVIGAAKEMGFPLP